MHGDLQQLQEALAQAQARVEHGAVVEKLHAVSTALARALTPADVASVVTGEIATCLGADQAILAVPVGHELELRTHANLSSSTLSLSRFPITSNLPAAVTYRTGTSLWYESRSAFHSAHPEAVLDGARAEAVVTVPLVVSGAALGVVGFAFFTPRSFDAKTQALVEDLAHRTALALERAKLYEEAHRRGREMELLFWLANASTQATTLRELYERVLAGACDVLGVDRASILLRDDAGVMRFVASRGLSDAYMRAVDGHSPWAPGAIDPQPVFIADANEDAAMTAYRDIFAAEAIRGLAFIPLVHDRRSIGKLMIYTRHPHVFTEHCEQLAMTLAAHVSAAVVRQRRTDAERAGALRIAVLARVSSQLVQSGLRRDAMLQALVRELERALDVDAAVTLLDDQHPTPRPYGLTPSSVCVPLRRGHLVIGTLEATRRRPGTPFAREDLQLFEDIAERAGTALANADVHAALEESNRSRDDILAVVSHDLRGPLSTIMMAATTMPADSPQVTRRLEMIQRNGAQMARLISDLLDFASIQSGRLAIVQSWFQPELVVAGAIENFTALAADRKVELVAASCPSPLPVLQSDRDRLIQALANLVANAVKITQPGGKVEVGVDARPGELRFWVRDSGPGIATEDQARIFERYWRGGRTTYRGHGLGLAISRGIVEALGGRIWVESAVGAGSTFSFSIPA